MVVQKVVPPLPLGARRDATMRGLHGIVLLALDAFGLWIQGLGHRATKKNGILVGKTPNSVDAGRSEDILDPVEDRVLAFLGSMTPRAPLDLVPTMMTDPSLAHDQRTKCPVDIFPPKEPPPVKA